MRYCDACGKQIPDQAAFCRSCGARLEGSSLINRGQFENESFAVGTSVGKNCPFCQTPIKPGIDTITCPKCEIMHHKDCWIANGNHCTTFGCDGLFTIPSQPLTIKAQGPFSIENIGLPPVNTGRVVNESNNNRKIIITGLIVVLIALAGFSFRSSLFGNETDNTNRNSRNGSSSIPNSPASSNNAIAAIDTHIVIKDRIDKNISDIAVRFNQKLNNSRGQFVDPQLKREIQEVQKTVYQARTDLQNISVPTVVQPTKQLLSELYNLEIIRINAISEGLSAVERGGEYSPALKPGTDASYKYDDVNVDFSRTYANLLRQQKP